MEDANSKWFDFSLKAVDRLNSMDGDWQRLSGVEQELAALWKLEADMNNGGFVQFFCNWGFDCYQFSRRALNNIQAYDALKIIEKEFAIIDAVFARYKNELKEYWDIPRYLEEGEIEELNRLDEEFWGYPDDISQLGLGFYKA
ncbi:DMP19 family protein [Gallaecimonas xiamenensis]|uniref:DNA mimic protein DMP19 C-terminal domain-containing protein n=1 Tax=Gallaecimonas xiamenensis 3-C-1 TaxID=745411 RepID=K2KK99_9GAMM|nr:DUF4375 domain-containing protein [Gallaecimonas xiamenensis]EKE77800.1 hypothetical protein B3C1_00030 [Gallaecimonas xiamenensis 3-C-1]